MMDSPSAIRIDQPVPLRKVIGRETPAASHADQDRAEVVDRQRGDPHCDAPIVEEAGDHEQRGTEDRGRSKPQKRTPAVRIVASDERGEKEMQQTNYEIGDAEEHGIVPEGAWHGHRDDEHCPHRGEHRQPHATLVHICRAG